MKEKREKKKRKGHTEDGCPGMVQGRRPMEIRDLQKRTDVDIFMGSRDEHLLTWTLGEIEGFWRI